MQPKPWRGISVVEKAFLGILPFVTVLCLVIPVLDESLRLSLTRASGGQGVVNWFLNENGNWVILLLSVVLFGLVLVTARLRLNRDKGLWFDTGCPNCEQRELVRVARQRRDRYYGWIGIRAYRYACRNCAWRGLRIGHRHHQAAPPSRIEEDATLMSDLALDEVNSIDVAAALPPALDIPVAAAPSDADARAAHAATVASLAALLPALEEDQVTHPADAPTFESQPLTPQAVAAAEPQPLKSAAVAPVTPSSPKPDLPGTTMDSERAATFSEDELEWLWRRLSEDK